MGNVVQCRNVSKSYERGKESVAVLNHFNLDIADGEFVAIMGPSGSGETTRNSGVKNRWWSPRLRD